MVVGLTDDPATRDRLGVGSYYVGLSEFIQGCPTPMTVALQGDWGTGKTTAMQMVRDHLKAVAPTAKVVEFNTWQYSQFDLGDRLVFTLLQAILEKIAPPMRVAASHELLKKAVRFVAGGTGAAVRMVVSTAGGTAGQKTLEIVDAGIAAAGDTPLDVDLTAQLVDIRAEFAEIVSKHVTKDDSGTGRVVIFIDDLDRLPPTRAIEVLEALKTLFDCPGCVFVLAIDFDVVRRGVRGKYGDDMDESKARAYFDKFIQVPFQMPVAEYQMAQLLHASLSALEIDADEAARFEELAAWSIGSNPRALKRLLNTFILLDRIAAARYEGESTKQSGRTFALLALEAAYPQFYAEVTVAVANSGLEELLASAGGPPGQDGLAGDPEQWGVERQRAAQFRKFVTLLPDVLGTEEDVAEALHRTSLTAVKGRTAPTDVLTDPAEKAARAEAAGIDAERLRQAGHLELLLAQEVADRGGVFESALRSKADWWHWYARSTDGRSKSWGQLVFAGRRTITLYFGSPAWPAGERDPLEKVLRELADRNGWRFETADKGTYFRIHGIRGNDDIADLVPVLADCAELAVS